MRKYAPWFSWRMFAIQMTLGWGLASTILPSSEKIMVIRFVITLILSFGAGIGSGVVAYRNWNRSPLRSFQDAFDQMIRDCCAVCGSVDYKRAEIHLDRPVFCSPECSKAFVHRHIGLLQ